MGIEYHITVPASAREKVAEALSDQLSGLLNRVDPKANESFPNVFVKMIPEGLYVCDNLTDPAVASLLIRSLIDLVLQFSPEVTLVEP